MTLKEYVRKISEAHRCGDIEGLYRLAKRRISLAHSAKYARARRVMRRVVYANPAL